MDDGALPSHYENSPMQYTDFYELQKLKISLEFFLIILIFLLKTLIVGTRCEAILTSTPNLCLTAKIRKLLYVYHTFTI